MATIAARLTAAVGSSSHLPPSQSRPSGPPSPRRGGLMASTPRGNGELGGILSGPKRAIGWGQDIQRKLSSTFATKSTDVQGPASSSAPSFLRASSARAAAAGAVGGMGQMVSDLASKFVNIPDVAKGDQRGKKTSAARALAMPLRENMRLDDEVGEGARFGPLERFRGYLEFRASTSSSEDEVDDDNSREGSNERAGVPDISAYLHETGTKELRYIRMLSNLTALTYSIEKLDERTLYKQHKLHLVTTSKIFFKDKGEVFGPECQAPDEADMGPESPDRMARELFASGDGQGWVGSPAADTGEAPFAGLSRPLALAARLGSRASVATAGAVMGALATASNAAAALASRDESSPSSSPSPASKPAPPADCPSEWYVADSKDRRVRYFVVQGSDSVASWRTNLQFDPCTFESPELGIRVHRGFYEAALALYDTLLPMVREHVAGGEGRRVAFTGHSLGGSLGTLIAMMLVHRGEVPPEAIKTVYTFGAPGVAYDALEEGGEGGEGARPRTPRGAVDAGDAWFAAEDEEGAGQSVAEVAEAWAAAVGAAYGGEGTEDIGEGWEGFARSARLRAVVAGGAAGGAAEVDFLAFAQAAAAGARPPPEAQHEAPSSSSSSSEGGAEFNGEGDEDKPRLSILGRLGLSPNHVRNVMVAHDVVPRAFSCDYSPVQQLLVSGALGPSFKNHGALLLESRQVLYTPVGSTLVLQPAGRGMDPHPMLPPGPGLYTIREPSGTAAALRRVAAGAVRPRALGGPGADGGDGGPVESMDDAHYALMNCPHPLEALSDPGAYGTEGGVSRYHNPDNYTRALSRVLQERRFDWHLRGAPDCGAESCSGGARLPAKVPGFGRAVTRAPGGARAARGGAETHPHHHHGKGRRNADGSPFGSPQTVKTVREAQTRRANQGARR